jgi:hypothetical protein
MTTDHMETGAQPSPETSYVSNILHTMDNDQHSNNLTRSRTLQNVPKVPVFNLRVTYGKLVLTKTQGQKQPSEVTRGHVRKLHLYRSTSFQCATTLSTVLLDKLS